MEKVDLDKEYNLWKEENEEILKEKFLDTHNFYDYLEEEWQKYQDERGLIDKSNDIEKLIN